MVQFCYRYIGSGTLLSIRGPINYFDQVVQEILQNSYLKNNFENSKTSDFVSTLWNFLRGKFSKKILFFRTLTAHIWRTGNATKIKKSILKSSHQGLSFKGYLHYKTIFCNKAALINEFFYLKKNNVSFSRYLVFCVFVKYSDFKICDAITDIAS